nr:MFS transporter [Streptomyces boncukensis]
MIRHTPQESRRRSAPAVLGVLATAQFLVVLSASIVNVALPQIRDGLALGPSGLSWVVNAYVLVFGALLLLGGRLGDVYGLRRVFLTGAALFAASSLAAGLATGPTTLIAARAVQGAGGALLAPTALALALTLFPDPRGRALALGVWGAVSGAGGAAGVLLSGLLTGGFGWRSVFFAMVPFALAVLAAARLLPAAGPARRGRLDLPGSLTVTGGLIAVVYGLSDRSWPVAAAGAVLLAVFVVLQRRSAEPLVPARVLTAGSVAAANVLMTLLGAVWLGLFFLLPLYQQRALGYSPVETGLTQLPLAATVAVTSWFTSRLTGRFVLPAGIVLLAAGLAWLSPLPGDGTFLGTLLGPSLLIGAGLGVAFVRLTALSAEGVPAADSGLAGGLVNASRQVGGAVGLAALTAVSGTWGDSAAFRVLAALALLVGLLSLIVLTPRKETL